MCEVVSYIASLAEEDGSGHCMSITTVLFSDSVRERGPSAIVASLKCRVALQEDDNEALVDAGVRHMPANKGDRLLGPRVALWVVHQHTTTRWWPDISPGGSEDK